MNVWLAVNKFAEICELKTMQREKVSSVCILKTKWIVLEKKPGKKSAKYIKLLQVYGALRYTYKIYFLPLTLRQSWSGPVVRGAA